MSQFLSVPELKRLTRTSEAVKMAAWLKAEGFMHRVGLDGYPVVLWDHVRAVLCGEKQLPKKPAQVDTEGMRAKFGGSNGKATKN